VAEDEGKEEKLDLTAEGKGHISLTVAISRIRNRPWSFLAITAGIYSASQWSLRSLVENAKKVQAGGGLMVDCEYRTTVG